MTKAAGRLSLSTPVRAASRREGMEFPAAFYKPFDTATGCVNDRQKS
ncbi:MAG: hypothetical protein V7K86_13895 [Nostoc sp.]